MQKDDNNGIHFNYTYTNEQLNHNYDFSNLEKNEIIQLLETAENSDSYQYIDFTKESIY